jgi:hypothetical protein
MVGIIIIHITSKGETCKVNYKSFWEQKVNRTKIKESKWHNNINLKYDIEELVLKKKYGKTGCSRN